MKRELTIIPVPDPRLIPRYLLDQVKERAWEPEEWYELQAKLVGVDSNLVLSLIDRQHQIKGLLWLTIDAFQKFIHINILSVDKAYQKRQKLINFVGKYIRNLAKQLDIELVTWSAKRTKAYEKYGFCESEYKILESKVV